MIKNRISFDKSFDCIEQYKKNTSNNKYWLKYCILQDDARGDFNLFDSILCWEWK